MYVRHWGRVPGLTFICSIFNNLYLSSLSFKIDTNFFPIFCHKKLKSVSLRSRNLNTLYISTLIFCLFNHRTVRYYSTDYFVLFPNINAVYELDLRYILKIVQTLTFQRLTPTVDTVFQFLGSY